MTDFSLDFTVTSGDKFTSYAHFGIALVLVIRYTIAVKKMMKIIGLNA